MTQECRHCRRTLPQNTLTYHGYCEQCWTQHELGLLDLDSCHTVTINGVIRHQLRKDVWVGSHAGLPDRPYRSATWEWVQNFARRMEYKMSLHRDRGGREGWLVESLEWLFARGMEEGGEIAKLMTHCPDDREENWAELLADECADQANLWMMLADKALHDYPREPRR